MAHVGTPEGLDPAAPPLHSQLIKRNVGSLSEINARVAHAPHLVEGSSST